METYTWFVNEIGYPLLVYCFLAASLVAVATFVWLWIVSRSQR